MMFSLTHKVFVTLIIIVLAYLNSVHANVNDHAIVSCLNRLTESFKVHTHEPITVTNYRNNPSLTKERFFKYALLSLNTLMDTSKGGVKINGVSNIYYYSFNLGLDSANIMDKATFCSTKNLTTNALKHLPTEPQTCTNQLKNFPGSAEDALRYAFYDVCINNFQGMEFAEAYMRHMETYVKVKDDFPEPEKYCRDTIEESYKIAA